MLIKGGLLNVNTILLNKFKSQEIKFKRLSKSIKLFKENFDKYIEYISRM